MLGYKPDGRVSSAAVNTKCSVNPHSRYFSMLDESEFQSLNFLRK